MLSQQGRVQIHPSLGLTEGSLLTLGSHACVTEFDTGWSAAITFSLLRVPRVFGLPGSSQTPGLPASLPLEGSPLSPCHPTAPSSPAPLLLRRHTGAPAPRRPFPPPATSSAVAAVGAGGPPGSRPSPLSGPVPLSGPGQGKGGERGRAVPPRGVPPQPPSPPGPRVVAADVAACSGAGRCPPRGGAGKGPGGLSFGFGDLGQAWLSQPFLAVPVSWDLPTWRRRVAVPWGQLLAGPREPPQTACRSLVVWLCTDHLFQTTS